jgi:23S rRNA pseudouridine1911/1915/1917 synthase
LTTIELEFPFDTPPERLDHFVSSTVSDLSRAAAHRLIESGNITVNGGPAKQSLKLKSGDLISIILPPPEPAEAEAEEIPLEILFEDRDIIVVNKPAGMVVHPGAGNHGGTLVNALLAHCTDLSGIGGTLRPGIVHRIDKDTSGVIVAAKNDHAHQSLSDQFKEHSIKRIYLALVFGSPKTDSGSIDSTIGRHPVDRKKMSSKARHGKHAVTRWKAISRFEGVTLVQLRLETGRTHQIRVHLSEAGYPLAGDQLYTTPGRLTALRNPRVRALLKNLHRQALHAKTLGFIHPSTGEYLEFDTDLPLDLSMIVKGLEELQEHT